MVNERKKERKERMNTDPVTWMLRLAGKSTEAQKATPTTKTDESKLAAKKARKKRREHKPENSCLGSCQSFVIMNRSHW